MKESTIQRNRLEKPRNRPKYIQQLNESLIQNNGEKKDYSVNGVGTTEQPSEKKGWIFTSQIISRFADKEVTLKKPMNYKINEEII